VDAIDRLHRESVVCDLHADTLQRIVLGESLAGHGGHLDLPRMREGGLDLQFFSVWVDLPYLPQSDGTADRCFARACEMLDAFDREMRTHAERIAPVRSAAEARDVLDSGRIAAALGVEGGHAIENDLEKLEALHGRGVRYLTLTWNNSTEWADSAKQETLHGTRHGGLTDFGERVVKRMNDLGMIVDLSHAAESTFWHVLRVSRQPVMASHSNAWALSPHYRNLKDEQIRALGERGGLIGINFYSSFLSAAFADSWQRAEQANKDELDALEKRFPYDYPHRAALELEVMKAEMGHVPVPATCIVDHIQHIAALIGTDHIALGSDFDGTNALPDDVPDVAHLPLVTRLLHERGFADSDIRKILGENVLRFFEMVCG
jgi:membrane dipeptidase